MMKKIAIFGSTGSIGKQACDVAQKLNMRVTVLAAKTNYRQLEEQVRALHPELVVLRDDEAAGLLRERISYPDVRILSGEAGLIEAASSAGYDLALMAITGIAGLKPVLAAIESGHDIALANKESLVCAGHLVTAAAEKQGTKIIPVDSEHSAIRQCISGEDMSRVKRLILTASGGPFWGRPTEELKHVTKEDALKHPTWNMGEKITIDSATMMNKGFEIIEAFWLFGIPVERIDVLIHRESIVHSFVEFSDNSVLAQLSAPDMRLPIEYALGYPDRHGEIVDTLDLCKLGKLTFQPTDDEAFPAVPLARYVVQKGGNAGAVMNGANEEAVKLFLDGKISYLDITRLVTKAVETIDHISDPTLDEILESDRLARRFVEENCSLRG